MRTTAFDLVIIFLKWSAVSLPPAILFRHIFYKKGGDKK